MQKPVHRQLSQRRIKEAFQQLWDYNSPAWAAKFLDEWCRQTMRSRIEPMKKIARSLRQHRELILNYFRAQKLISSGVVEGLNNKAKVTMRKSYGFRTFRVLELALYHSLGKLPEPESKIMAQCSALAPDLFMMSSSRRRGELNDDVKSRVTILVTKIGCQLVGPAARHGHPDH